MIFFDINTINIPPDLIIDGKKITSKKNCFSFFASFLGVENQYINNWDALFDSLRDFDISIYNSFTIKIINSDILLCTENENEKESFLKVLEDTQIFFSKDFESDKPWGHKGIDFKIYI